MYRWSSSEPIGFSALARHPEIMVAPMLMSTSGLFLDSMAVLVPLPIPSEASACAKQLI